MPVDRVTRRKFRMAQDSDDPFFVVNIVVWVLVVILAIVALHWELVGAGGLGWLLGRTGEGSARARRIVIDRWARGVGGCGHV